MTILQRRQWLVAMPLLMTGGWGLAQVRDLNDAINKAGRQRMLSQRCAKAYLALGQGVRKDQAEKVLSESMALFDRQQVELKAFAPTEVRATYDQLESTWSNYKQALVGAVPSKAGAGPVLTAAGATLQLAHQGTVQLEQVSGKPLGRLVNIAGRQRMLSQRMAAMFLAASWGVQADSAVKALTESREEFVKAMVTLKTAPEATAAIKAELELGEQQYAFFDAALKGLRAGNGDPKAMTDVFTTSERILQVMDGVTALFARAS